MLLVDPSTTRRRGEIAAPTIPLNAYCTPLAEERKRLGDDTLRRMLRDMMVIREFEFMLDRMKRGDGYAGVQYNHRGPAHLSIGQEAVAVGEALHLRSEDHIFGSHRSHGEIIAKGLSAIAASNATFLQETMEGYLEGDILQVVEEHLPAPDLETRAVQFLLYGLLAEIFGRETGFNRGMGGSMHAFFPPFGIYPNNAIVGGSAGIAAGAALYKKLRMERSIVIANIGDGSSACGPVWEAMNFATMGQFWTLWEEEYRGGLPIIFAFVDNFYAMGGQTVGETMGYDHLSRIGSGLNPQNAHAETVDGNNPLAVADAIWRAVPLLQSGHGPILLDIQCYRQSGHSASDASSYRSREELDRWRAIDPIVEFAEALEVEGALCKEERAALQAWAQERVAEICPLATDLAISPRLDRSKGADAISELMFSNVTREIPVDHLAKLRVPLDQCSRVRAIARSSRSGIGPDGSLLPATNAVTVRDALFEAIVHHFAHDDLLIAYGEECRDWDGAFGVYRGLTELLPYHRLFNSPIAEAAIVGTAVGYALEGGRALVELMYADFIGRAGDELFNQLSKWQAMSGGTLRMPVVVRVSVGNKYGAQHSQDWTSLMTHIPGLKVVFPVTPYDAKGLMASALSGDDPVIFFESQRLYDTVEMFHPGGVPVDYYRIPLGEPDVKRVGRDVTLVSVGATLYRALAAADRLASEFGVGMEIIDARSLVPFNYDPVLESVRKTGRLLLTSDASERGSFLNVLATEIEQMAFDDLDAPVTVVGARNWIAPPTEMESTYLPQPEWLLDAVDAYLLPLQGYTPATQHVGGNRVSRARAGL